MKNVSVGEVLDEIEAISEFRFLYISQDLDVERKVDINVRKKKIEDILPLLFDTSNMEYQISDRQILLKKKESLNIPVKATPLNLKTQGLQQTITGTVTDNEGLPLPGANVIVKGSSVGTQTDFDGNYSLDVPAGASTLVFSYVGFATKEIAINGQTNISVQMEIDAAGLEEVVVVGYGTQKKETVTGAVSGVKGEALTKAPVANLTNSFAGRISGLFVQQTSGEPGYDDASIRIRGTNTFNNSGALVVIDGIPDRAGGLSRINPEDIEDVSVLKDASAAIYGARAANGVILITTKRGTTGKPQLTYTFNQGWSQPVSTPDQANAVEYAELRNELEVYNLPVDEWQAANEGFINNGTYTRPDGSVRNAPFSPEDIALFQNGQDPWGHPNTDWFDETFKTWSPQAKHNLQLTGGTENVRYLASLGYQNQDGYYKNSATGYKQYDLRLNLDAKINDYLNLNLGVLGREEYRFFPTQSAGAIFRMLVRGRPTEPAYWPNGMPGPDIENGQNPVVITTNATGYDDDKRDFFQSNANLDIKVPGVEGLTFKLTAAVDKNFRNQKRWTTPWYLYTWDGTTYGDDGDPLLVRGKRGPAAPNLNQASANTLNILLGANGKYEKTIGDHFFGVMAGINRETEESEFVSAFRQNFLSDAIDQISAGSDTAEDKNNSGGFGEKARLNYFGRVNYDYKKKYLLEFLWRYDGSYLFPESGRYGFFPGVSAGWVVSSESFFEEKVPFMSFLKIRGSWGQLGNDDVPPYQFIGDYSSRSYVIGGQQTTTYYETKVPNPDITWEIATNTNIGFDAKFLNNKISMEFDYFYNKRESILTQPNATLPNLSGITPPRQNIGEVENKGFDLLIGYNDQFGDFSFGATFTSGYAKNKLLFIDEPEGAPEWQLRTGKTIGSNLAYGYDGVFATQADIDNETLDYSAVTNNLRPGDMKLVDYDGDGRITPDDRYRTNKNNNPTFNYGLNITAAYKNFDLTMLWQGAAGAQHFLNFGEAGTIGNYPKRIYDNRWTVNNPSSVHPRIADRGNQYYSSGNTYWAQDTDYLRLKNLQIGYTLPKNIVNKAGIENFRLYVSGFNLLTFSDTYFDPESTSGDGRNYPNPRVMNLGFALTF
jgi:TonB-linked SusC/RagA family outer membrane protein